MYVQWGAVDLCPKPKKKKIRQLHPKLDGMAQGYSSADIERFKKKFKTLKSTYFEKSILKNPGKYTRLLTSLSR